MMGTVTANWNIPLAQSRSFFTDLIQRMYELDSNLIDQDCYGEYPLTRVGSSRIASISVAQ